MTTPAKSLLGLDLPNGWKVIEALPAPKYQGGTGGFFSTGYIVEKGGQRAFMKALDFSAALQAPDPALALQSLTEAYNFERQVLINCRDKRLSRIILALDDGKINVDPKSPVGVVQYLIFELAENDVRKQLNRHQDLDLAWRLRTIHQVAVGLRQLHNEEIAHQDLKPSNVLLVKEAGGKLADLGCAAIRSGKAPRDGLEIPGDPTYAPPELLYHYVPGDWATRRFGCDLYLLGSMLAFVFSSASMTHMLFSNLDPSMLPGRWTDTYVSVLPYLRDAMDRAIRDVTVSMPPQVRGDLESALRQLCDPDPSKRGHPLARVQIGSPYSLERHISLLDLLSRKAEVRLLRPSS